MRAAFALRIVSGKNIFICSSETPAGVSELLFHGKGFRTNSLSQNLTVLTAPSEREPLAWREGFGLKRKVCGCARSPLGELSCSD